MQQPHNQKQLSAWLRPHVVAHPNFGSASASLTRFFKEREASAAAAAKAAPPRKPASPVKNTAFTSSGLQGSSSTRTGAKFLGAQVSFVCLNLFHSSAVMAVVTSKISLTDSPQLLAATRRFRGQLVWTGASSDGCQRSDLHGRE